MKDITGERFGMLVALAPAHRVGGHWKWYFQCDCGNFCLKTATNVQHRTGARVLHNCGCATSSLLKTARGGSARYTKHGLASHPAYFVWNSMRSRCANPKNKSYRNYGGRGISVCPEWEASFEAFWADMGLGYALGLQIDRIDTNGDYTPRNTHWVTPKQNSRNRREHHILFTQWGSITAVEAAERAGIQYKTLCTRLARGWDTTTALNAPIYSRRGLQRSTA